MKIKLSLLFVFLITQFDFANAQLDSSHAAAPKFYATAEVGYAFENFVSHVAGNVDFWDIKDLRGSLGTGFIPTIRAGYMLHPNVCFEVGISYVSGLQQEFGPYEFSNGNSVTYKFDGRTIRIMPSFKFTTRTTFKSFATIGFIVGAATEANLEVIESSAYSKSVFTDGNALGWYASFGVDYKCKKNLSFFLKADLIYQTYYPTHGETDFYNDASGMPHIHRTHNYDTSQDDTHWFSFNSIGINLGIKFSFGGKKKDAAPPAKDVPPPAEVK